VTDNTISEGLLEYLQATAPEWATRLTMERVTFLRIVSNLKEGQRLVEDRSRRLEALRAEAEHYLDHPGCNQRSRITAMNRLRWAIDESRKGLT